MMGPRITLVWWVHWRRVECKPMCSLYMTTGLETWEVYSICTQGLMTNKKHLNTMNQRTNENMTHETRNQSEHDTLDKGTNDKITHEARETHDQITWEARESHDKPGIKPENYKVKDMKPWTKTQNQTWQPISSCRLRDLYECLNIP